MPLKDRRNRTRLVRAGIIRLGHKEVSKRTGNEYPVQDDHFLLHDAPDLKAHFDAQGVEEVRELIVTLPFPDPVRNFDANYEVWAGGVLVCQGDGEVVRYATPHVTERKGKRVSVRNAPGDTLVSDGVAQCSFSWNGEQFGAGDTVPCPGAAADMYPHCAACKMSAVLKVMMAEPAELVRLAYYQVRTGSGRNYDTIDTVLRLVNERFGRVSGIRYTLRLVEESTTYQDESGMRRQTDKWFIQLEPHPVDVRKLVHNERATQLRLESAVSALPATIDGETGEVMETEWNDDAFEPTDDPAPPPDPVVEAAEDLGATVKDAVTRPLPAEKVRAAIIKKAGRSGMTGPASPKQGQLVAQKLEECFGGEGEETNKRYSVLAWLTGYRSTKDLTKAQASAILDWLLVGGDDPDTKYDLHPAAYDESHAVLVAAMKDAGQQELEL